MLSGNPPERSLTDGASVWWLPGSDPGPGRNPGSPVKIGRRHFPGRRMLPGVGLPFPYHGASPADRTETVFQVHTGHTGFPDPQTVPARSPTLWRISMSGFSGINWMGN